MRRWCAKTPRPDGLRGDGTPVVRGARPGARDFTQSPVSASRLAVIALLMISPSRIRAGRVASGSWPRSCFSRLAASGISASTCASTACSTYRPFTTCWIRPSTCLSAAASARPGGSPTPGTAPGAGRRGRYRICLVGEKIPDKRVLPVSRPAGCCWTAGQARSRRVAQVSHRGTGRPLGVPGRLGRSVLR